MLLGIAFTSSISMAAICPSIAMPLRALSRRSSGSSTHTHNIHSYAVRTLTTGASAGRISRRHRRAPTCITQSTRTATPHTLCHQPHRSLQIHVPLDDARWQQDVFLTSNTAFRTFVLNTCNTTQTHNLTLPLLQRLRTLFSAINQHEELTGCMVCSSDVGIYRVFVEGGDLRGLYDYSVQLQQSESSQPQQSSDDLLQLDASTGNYHTQYLQQVYHLLYYTSTMRKPYFGIMDGLTLGTGYALVGHGRFKFATEHTQLAFPEVNLGLMPHNGSMYMLGRVFGEFGRFLALTGWQLKGADVFHCGLATHYQESDGCASIPSKFDNHYYPHRLQAELAADATHAQAGELPAFTFSKSLLDFIDSAFRYDTVEEIIEALQATANDYAHQCHKFALECLQRMQYASPLALKVTLATLQLSKTLSFEQCLQLEYRVMQRLLQNNDFVVGYRTNVLEQSDSKSQQQRQTKWTHSSLEAVDETAILQCLTPFRSPAHELQLQRPDPTLRFFQSSTPHPTTEDGKIYQEFSQAGIGFAGSVMTTEQFRDPAYYEKRQRAQREFSEMLQDIEETLESDSLEDVTEVLAPSAVERREIARRKQQGAGRR